MPAAPPIEGPSRVTVTFVEAGAWGSQHRSRSGTTHATKASAATARADASSFEVAGRFIYEVAPARERAGHSPRSVRATPSS